MPQRLTFRQRLDRYPPILVRLMTTRRTKSAAGTAVWVPTDEQLADAAGLPLATFKFVAYSTSWDAISIDAMYRFLMACDIDLEKRRCFRRIEHLRRRGQFRHLRRDPLWATVYEPMVALLPE
jgi:hypothetical protein